MHLLAFFRWWYGAGWTDQLGLARTYVRRVNDFFSISLLLSTLFQPFRQISASSVRGSLGVQLRAWFDKLISRVVGAFTRLIMILIGSVWLLFSVCFQALWLLMWPFVPFIPLLGIVASGVSR